MEHGKEIIKNNLLDDIIKKYEDRSLPDYYSDPLMDYLKSKELIAFQELFLPMVRLAREQLSTIIKHPSRLISSNAMLSLEYYLLELLSHIASKVLETEFSLYRARYMSSLDRFLNGNGSRKLYESFIKLMYEGEFIRLLKEYAALSKLFVTIITQWADTSSELISRLEEDIECINDTFFSKNAVETVKQIECGLSDRHNGGRTVAIITFENGSRLVYKPRSLGMEDAWFKLLAQLNECFSFGFFKCIKVINKAAYGWMEYVEHLPCENENGIELYYRRTGALLCLVHCLRGTDCHYQNLIACGPYPVLIDLETLFHPYTRELNVNWDIKEPDTDSEKYYSVLRTGLLPQSSYVQHDKSFDFSGLGAGTDTPPYPKSFKWAHINTDNMKQEFVEREYSLPTNLPFCGKKIFAAKEFINEIMSGFKSVYAHIMINRELFIGPIGLLCSFQSIKTRIVLRSTIFYNELIKTSLEPQYMRSELNISILADTLNNKFIYSNDKFTNPILEEEKNNLEEMNIPYFVADANSVSLETRQKVLVCKFLPCNGINLVLKMLNAMSEADMEMQVRYMISAFE